MASKTSKYKIGDLVRCFYGFFEFYSYFYEGDEYMYLPFYGIVVELETNWLGMETVYKISCLDGEYRFFLEDEIEKTNATPAKNS